MRGRDGTGREGKGRGERSSGKVGRGGEIEEGWWWWWGGCPSLKEGATWETCEKRKRSEAQDGERDRKRPPFSLKHTTCFHSLYGSMKLKSHCILSKHVIQTLESTHTHTDRHTHSGVSKYSHVRPVPKIRNVNTDVERLIVTMPCLDLRAGSQQVFPNPTLSKSHLFPLLQRRTHSETCEAEPRNMKYVPTAR